MSFGHDAFLKVISISSSPGGLFFKGSRGRVTRYSLLIADTDTRIQESVRRAHGPE